MIRSRGMLIADLGQTEVERTIKARTAWAARTGGYEDLRLASAARCHEVIASAAGVRAAQLRGES